MRETQPTGPTISVPRFGGIPRACADFFFDYAPTHCNNKVTVACLAPSSGHCKAFSATIPPLQVALSFACSVASLSHSPSFQLPGWHRLHGGSLADYLLGWGRASTCTAGRAGLQCASMPKLPCGPQELPPSNQVVAQLAPVAWFSCGVGMVPERCPCRYDATILADGHTASNAPDLF